MQYRKNKKGEDISLLGFGCMRFSRKGNSIDVDKATEEVKLAIENGVNYFDTAYLYPGNEVAVGEIMKRLGCREKINIATKLPQYMVKNASQIDKYFDEELSRLQTDYVDYYLMHMFTDFAAWEKMKKFGIVEWIQKKKESGQIRNIGFSYHGDTAKFLEILNDFDWDFCQIQYNYLDENTQAGRKGLEAAYEKGIPVIIMEPLRGGKLVDLLPTEAKEKMKKHPHGWSPATWAFKWLYNQPGVTCVLSGMNSLEMVEENVKTASESSAGMLTEEDMAFYEEIKNIINSKVKVGCTACAYCMPCPKGVNIPLTFACYNQMYTENKNDARFNYAQNTALQKERKDYSQCIKCGKCEAHCPQHIAIREKLEEAGKHLQPWYFRVAIKVIRLFKFW